MDRPTQELISKLLKHVENYDHKRVNSNSEDVLKEYSELINSLKIDNPIHQNLNKNIHSNLTKDIILNTAPDSATDKNNIIANNSLPNKKRIKYENGVELSDLENIVAFSLWKNTPNTNNLFKVYESKKNNLLNNNFNNNVNKSIYSNIGASVNKSYNNNNSYISKTSNNSYNSFLNKKNNNNLKENEDNEEDGGEGKFIQSNNYMCNSYNLKRKNNNNANTGNNGMDYEDYTNSIYNVNKKKKNTNNNAYKKGNNRYNKNNIEEEEEEINKEEQDEVGFKNAINMINKKVFKGNNNSNYNYNREQNQNQNRDSNNFNINEGNNDFTGSNNEKENKSINGFKKFNPPYKTNNNTNSNNKIANIKKEEDKEKELDEKLKGFDKKLIEFIESEILSFSPNVKWEDIAGLEFAKKTIKEIIIWPLLRPDIFNGIRRPPKGLLLFGPPGTGKTMIAKAIASESKSKFFNISASSLMSKWIGESEKLVRTLFALASFYQPSVVFIDEIDSILTARSENECEASRRLKTEFLVQLDGAGTNQDDRILIIGATNRPQEIDDAFIRRLAKRLYIPLPNPESRKQLVLNVIKKEKEKSKYDLTEDDVATIVSKSKGYSGSDMMGVCREAAMMPIRNIDDIFNVQLDNLRGINLGDFTDALNNVKPSVSEKTIAQYIQWNRDFGSFQFEEKDSG